MIVEAKYDHNGNPEFDAADFKEMEARARGPDVLTPQEEAMVVEAKEQGNEHFKAGRVEEALGSYHRALTVFSDRKGGPEQRLEKSKLMANRAECQLRLELWEAAEKSAANALALDAANAKARFRRARALTELGGEPNLKASLDELEELKRASTNGALGRAETLLQRRVVKERADLKKAHQRASDGLKKAFASGNAGLISKEEVEDKIRNGSKSEIEERIAALSDRDASTFTADPKDPSGWCDQLFDLKKSGPVLAQTRYAWLVDVYRTRVDDDGPEKCGKSFVHGLMDDSCSAASVVLDFLVFCKLAVTNGVIASAEQWTWWRWAAFLEEASLMLGKAFEPKKCNAELRYGAKMGDGERLREVGRLVYDDANADPALGASASYTKARAELHAACWQEGGVDKKGRKQHLFTFDRHPAAFIRVGGSFLWQAFLTKVGEQEPWGDTKVKRTTEVEVA